MAECLAVNHVAIMTDEQDSARNFVVLDRALDNGIEHAQFAVVRILSERWRAAKP